MPDDSHPDNIACLEFKPHLGGSIGLSASGRTISRILFWILFFWHLLGQFILCSCCPFFCVPWARESLRIRLFRPGAPRFLSNWSWSGVRRERDWISPRPRGWGVLIDNGSSSYQDRSLYLCQFSACAALTPRYAGCENLRTNVCRENHAEPMCWIGVSKFSPLACREGHAWAATRSWSRVCVALGALEKASRTKCETYCRFIFQHYTMVFIIRFSISRSSVKGCRRRSDLHRPKSYLNSHTDKQKSPTCMSLNLIRSATKL